MLQEGEGEHRHGRMAVKTLPGSPFEVVEAKFLFHLLMRLLPNPPCLNGNSQSAQIGRGRQVGEVVFFSPEGLCSPTSQASSPGRCC